MHCVAVKKIDLNISQLIEALTKMAKTWHQTFINAFFFSEFKFGIQISLQFVHKGPIHNKAALRQLFR